ncbi:Fucose-specific lectin domain-containing protein [Dioscorea alata]|nr:Fucose-specific lectin domain-containing protein [Dioscorea alata]
MDDARKEESQFVQIKSGLVSHDGERLYVTTTDKTLLEVSEVQPLRWYNHGRPLGGDVSAVADAGAIRPGVVFIISSNGDLYEFDKKSKPSWKKHIWSEELGEEISLIALPGSTLQGLVGAHSVSLFLLTKDGLLIERGLHKRKWKWRVHGAPEGHHLSSITAVEQNEQNEKHSSLFLTTTTGLLFEYQLPKHSAHFQGNRIDGLWVNHMHPHHAKVARGIRGVQMQLGRMIFALDDGRLGELHFPGIGGESHGPNQQSSLRRKASNQYEWSALEVPETEGWNAEYCTDERGSSNCILGIKEMPADDDPNDSSSTIPAKRRKAQEKQDYISLSNHEGSSSTESTNFLTKSMKTNFRMRAMHVDRSFFIITENGQTFEYLYADHVWLWLKHEHSTEMKGTLGSYNGSLFFVDTHGSLLMRERNGNELSWINCTAMRKGRQVATGPPWDGTPGGMRRVTAEDALFLVNKKGRLIQFTVALRNFKWKDCGHPPDTKVAYIIDQEVLRMHIVFVIGRNGRIYQYNKLTELWHGHYQSPHLVLSRTPGTAMRPSHTSLTGSLFMISENGGLVEYRWSSVDGWEWVEHGTPSKDVILVGAPGPCFDNTQLFMIGSDGQVYRRRLDQKAWQWTGHDHPQTQNAEQGAMASTKDDEQCSVEDKARGTNGFNGNCNEKVAPTRPIPLSEDAVIFELQDGRLAELRRPNAAGEWEWVRIIRTPTSQCLRNYWTAVAS